MHVWPAALMVALLTTACAPTPRAIARQPGDIGAAAEAQVPAPVAAKAKRAPPQPGEPISPVIAFRGLSGQWGLAIENTGGHAHSVDFNWGSGSRHATGTLQYQPRSGAPADAPILLGGSLDTATGPRAMRVEITAQPCTDDADQAHAHAVRVNVEGMPPMQGCGDLAK